MTARCIGRWSSGSITDWNPLDVLVTPRTRSLDRRVAWSVVRNEWVKYLKNFENMKMVDPRNRDHVALRGKFTLCDSTYPTWERIERQAGQPKERKMLRLRCLRQSEGISGVHRRRKNARGDVFLRRHTPQFRVSFAGIWISKGVGTGLRFPIFAERELSTNCWLKIARGTSGHRPLQGFQRQPHRTFVASSAGSTSD